MIIARDLFSLLRFALMQVSTFDSIVFHPRLQCVPVDDRSPREQHRLPLLLAQRADRLVVVR